MRPVVGLLLAAGSGRRFGGDKLLAALPDGRPVGEAAALALRAGVDRAIAIVRLGDTRLADLMQAAGMEVVTNPAAEDGMAGSIRRGVAASPDAAGWLIALADMPWIEPTTTASIADALRQGASIAAPVHQGRRGHPVGLHRRWAPKLMALTGDRGARDLIARSTAAMIAVNTSDSGVLRDVDRPEDLGSRSTYTAASPPSP